MGIKKSGSTKAFIKSLLAQSATEYLTVYGFALLALAVMAVLIYFFINAPYSAAPNQCSFPGYLSCKTLELGSNSQVSRAVFLLSNSQQYAITNATANIEITNIGSFSGGCNPRFVLPGGLLECTINFNKGITAKQFTSGAVYLSATVCSRVTQVGCTSPLQQTYGGSFTAHVSPLLPPPACTVSLSARNSTQLAPNGNRDLLTANVKILGTPVSGATVNYSSPSPDISFLPAFSNTDSNGDATTYVTSNSQGIIRAYASFGNCTGFTDINFVKPTYITFASNAMNTGNPIVAVNGIWYSTLPVSISTLAGSIHSYDYNTTVSISNGARYLYNSISGCGAVAQTGAVSSGSSNCTVSGNYITQYYLTVSAGIGGNALPLSGWYNSGSQASLSETPASGNTFYEWTCSGTGCYSGTNTIPTITMNNPITETANFQVQQSQQSQYTLTVDNNGCSSVSGGGTYNAGSSASFSVTVPAGYTFSGWTGSGTGSYTGSSTSSSVTMNSAITESATCTVNYYTLTIGIAYPPGVDYPYTYTSPAPGSYSYAYGTEVTIEALQYEETSFICSGYYCSDYSYYAYPFDSWTGGGPGSYSGTANPVTITIDGAVSEVANYYTSSGTTSSSGGFVGCCGTSSGDAGPDGTGSGADGSGADGS